MKSVDYHSLKLVFVGVILTSLNLKKEEKYKPTKLTISLKFVIYT